MQAYVEKGDRQVFLFTPYNANFVSDLKEEVPWEYRKWDQERRCWSVKVPYCDLAEEVLGRYFDFDYYENESQPERGSEQEKQSVHSVEECLLSIKQRYPSHAELHVLPDAPIEVVDAAWRALARLFHPDSGNGDESRMVRLNNAHDRIHLH